MVRGTLRTVWSDGEHIIKKYKRVRWPGDTRRPWILEHRCLTRLHSRGVPAPLSWGIDHVSKGTVLYRRQFVHGSILADLDNSKSNALADHLSAIHGAGVTTNDIALDNILITDKGQMIFVDYGRGRVFHFRSPLFYFYVGKELARVRRRLFPESADTWTKFCERYGHNTHYPSWGWLVIRISSKYWLKRWRVDWHEFGCEHKTAEKKQS